MATSCGARSRGNRAIDIEFDEPLQKKFKALGKSTPKKPPVAVVSSEEIKSLDTKMVAQGESVVALKAQIGSLEKTVSELTALLEGVSRNVHNIVFSGVNVQAVRW